MNEGKCSDVGGWKSGCVLEIVDCKAHILTKYSSLL
jgi:hypothetical protein